MDDGSLNSLGILSIESEITISLKYKYVIYKEFALQKAYRKIQQFINIAHFFLFSLYPLHLYM